MLAIRPWNEASWFGNFASINRCPCSTSAWPSFCSHNLQCLICLLQYFHELYYTIATNISFKVPNLSTSIQILPKANADWWSYSYNFHLNVLYVKDWYDISWAAKSVTLWTVQIRYVQMRYTHVRRNVNGDESSLQWSINLRIAFWECFEAQWNFNRKPFAYKIVYRK